MKKLLILVLIAGAGYLAWQKYSGNDAVLESLYEQPYVAVYGRDTCGWTQKYLTDISNAGMRHIYKSVDDPGVADELHPRMKQGGLDTGHYLLPVIDVNAKMFIRPEMQTVQEEYKNHL